MQKQLQLIQITPEELSDLISSKISEEIKKLSPTTNENKILTREETAKMLAIDISTLYRWTKKGKIRALSIGNRVYYKLSDIYSALKPFNE